MLNILILEDDADQAEVLAAMMARAGFSPLVTRDPDHAMQLIAERRFDAVVTDIFIRHQSVCLANGGLRVIGSIRNGLRDHVASTPRDVPIIALSGAFSGPTESYFLDMALSIGADAAIGKPASADTISATLMRLTGISAGVLSAQPEYRQMFCR